MPRWPTIASTVGSAAILSAFLIRAMTTHIRVPWWDLDQSVAWSDETGLRPSLAFLLDALVALAAAACVWASRSSERLHPVFSTETNGTGVPPVPPQPPSS